VSETKTSITNLALRAIGSYRIDDFDTDTGAEAQVARDVWDAARRDALASHEWRFAIRVVQLAQAGETPAGLYGYAYPLPSNFIALSSVSDRSSLDPALREFDMIDVPASDDEPRLCIVANKTALFIEYVYDHAKVGSWPPWFVTYMAAKLAAHMAGPLKSTTEADRLETLARAKLGVARTRDSTQQPVRDTPMGSWVSSMRTRR